MTKETVAGNVDAIVKAMTENAAGVDHDGDAESDARWAEAVIASLPNRSSEARQVLAKALLDGEANKAAPVGCAIFSNEA